MGYGREESKTRRGPGKVCNLLRMGEFILFDQTILLGTSRNSMEGIISTNR
jgi:hypothetical protein